MWKAAGFLSQNATPHLKTSCSSTAAGGRAEASECKQHTRQARSRTPGSGLGPGPTDTAPAPHSRLTTLIAVEMKHGNRELMAPRQGGTWALSRARGIVYLFTPQFLQLENDNSIYVSYWCEKPYRIWLMPGRQSSMSPPHYSCFNFISNRKN